MKTNLEIYEELGAATIAQEQHCTVMCDDATFEDGVIAALLWVLGSEGQTTLMVDNLREFNQADSNVPVKVCA